VDKLAELAVFSECSSGAVCITSYQQGAQSDICEARNIMDIKKFIILSLNIYIIDKRSAIFWFNKQRAVSISYRRFEKTYGSQLKGSF
jgi:hypothetical protein